MDFSKVTDVNIPEGKVSSISINGQEVWSSYEGLCFTAQEDNSNVSYTIHGSLYYINIQYSYNGRDWHDWDGSFISLMSNEKVYVRNTANTLSIGPSDYLQFVMTGKIASSGNVNSMINFAELHGWCYYKMFSGCTSLTEAPELPATTLKEECYRAMFRDCKSLTQAPELSATTIAEECYRYMFQGCASLTQTPELPATTLYNYCYEQMFQYCTSLKVNQNGTGTKIFTCPTTIPEGAVSDMFTGTGGTFTGTPIAGNTYNWYW